MTLFSRNQSQKIYSSFDKEPNAFSVRMSSTAVTFLLTCFFIIADNTAFFHALPKAINLSSTHEILFAASLTLLASLVTFIVLTLFVVPYLGPVFIIIFLVGAASATYFMNAYGIVIHQTMIQNMVETDTKEASDLFNYSLALCLVLLGLLPAFVMTRIKIVYASFWKELWIKSRNIAVSFLIAAVLLGSFSADYASFFRNNKEVRQLVNPANFIYASIQYLTESNKSRVIKPVGEDAKLNSFGKSLTKPTLLILVVGETARADHFSINGYERETTPLIAQQNIINYSDVYSCGTETAVSVPCMFSGLGREHYSDKKAKSQEGLLDIIKRSGFSVLWRDNNSGCKGTCNRVTYEDMSKLNVPELCNDHECFDNILLHQLNEKIAGAPNSRVIVLHQKGSHGPDYYKRVPDNMVTFKPVCQTNKLQDCVNDELVNAFDNTIHYTDFFLNSTIEWLKTQSSKYNTAMIYLSDHGESLGEKNLYLHGMPYVIAPQAQKHIPFFFWFSEGFSQENKIDVACLADNRTQQYSHDNLFHTLLGLLNIDTSLYQTQLDMVSGCRKE